MLFPITSIQHVITTFFPREEKKNQVRVNKPKIAKNPVYAHRKRNHLCVVVVFHSFVLLLEYNCITILYQFPLYNKVNQLYVYIYPIPLEPPSYPPYHCSRSSQSTELHVLYRAALHQLSVLHMVVYICQCYSINSSHPPLFPLCPQAHSLHTSLQIGSSAISLLSIYPEKTIVQKDTCTPVFTAALFA